MTMQVRLVKVGPKTGAETTLQRFNPSLPLA